MTNTVKGLRLQYFKAAFISSILLALSIFLPFAKLDGKRTSNVGMLLKVMGASERSATAFILLLGFIAVIIMCVGAVITLVKPSVGIARIWMIVSAFTAFCNSVLLFGSKRMIDGSGVFTDKFLVKNFGIGFWFGLILSYVNLVLVMKISKIHSGYIVLTILSVLWMFPILWIFLTSLRAESGYYVGYFIPRGFTLDNYKKLFEGSVTPFGKWWVNTFIVATCCCIVNALMILATAFTFSRTRFKGRKTIMKIMLIIGMFPGFMSMIAVYNILKGMGLGQTLTALIIVSCASAAMGYHVCKGFFDTIPASLDEAAIVDGATRFQIFTKITIPLSKPIIIYTILTSFLAPWSDYIFPSMLLGDKESSYTVAIGLQWMTNFRRIDAYYTQFAAGAIVVAVPIVLLFIWLQRYYVEGLAGAVKG